MPPRSVQRVCSPSISAPRCSSPLQLGAEQAQAAPSPPHASLHSPWRSVLLAATHGETQGSTACLLRLGRQQLEERLHCPVLDVFKVVAGAGLQRIHIRRIAAQRGGRGCVSEQRIGLEACLNQAAKTSQGTSQASPLLDPILHQPLQLLPIAPEPTKQLKAQHQPHRFLIPSSTSQYSRRRSPSRPASTLSSGCCSKNLQFRVAGQQVCVRVRVWLDSKQPLFPAAAGCSKNLQLHMQARTL